MICHFIKLLDSLDERPNDCFLFFENSYVSIYLCVAKLFVIKVPQSCWHLILAFMIEEYIKCACIIVNFKLSAHWLLYSSQQPASEDDIVDWVTIELAYIVRSWLRIHYHPHGNWCEHFLLSRSVTTPTLTVKASLRVRCTQVAL